MTTPSLSEHMRGLINAYRDAILSPPYETLDARAALESAIAEHELNTRRLGVLEELLNQQARIKVNLDEVWIWHLSTHGYARYDSLTEAADAELSRREKENG